MPSLLLFAAGLLLLLLGVLLLAVSGAGGGKAGGVILLGPIPIVFGGSSTKAFIAVFAVLFLFLLVMAILVGGWGH